MFDKKILGSRIKCLRMQAGLTQDSLAKMLSVTRTQISDLENGKTTTNLERLTQLADYFKVPTDYLLGIGIFENWELVMKNIDVLADLLDESIKKSAPKEDEFEIIEDASNETKNAVRQELNNLIHNPSIRNLPEDWLMHLFSATIEKVEFNENRQLTSISFK